MPSTGVLKHGKKWDMKKGWNKLILTQVDSSQCIENVKSTKEVNDPEPPEVTGDIED